MSLQEPPSHSRRHFEVEKELAARLRASTRAERRTLVGELYGELFARVPDHPRLVRRETAAESAAAVAKQMRLLRPHLRRDQTFLEIAPGDGRLSIAVAPHVRQVWMADISDQTGGVPLPANCEHRVFDGFDLDLPTGSVDLAFSYQFLEHLHPDDVQPHLELVARLVRPGGAYILDTPHRFSGPWDASRPYTLEPACFHMQEWTYGEVGARLRAAGFHTWQPYRWGTVRRAAPWRWATRLAEALLDPWPRRWERRLSARVFQAVTLLAVR